MDTDETFCETEDKIPKTVELINENEQEETEEVKEDSYVESYDYFDLIYEVTKDCKEYAEQNSLPLCEHLDIDGMNAFLNDVVYRN